MESIAKEVIKEIDAILQTKMVQKACLVGLKININNESRLVISIKKIGRAFKDDYVEYAVKITAVVIEIFHEDTGYEDYYERVVVKSLNYNTLTRR